MCAKCGGSMKKGGTMKKMENGGPNSIEKKIGRLENKKERLANKSSRASSISRNFVGDPDTLSKVVDNALQKRAMNVMEKVSNKREMINKKIEKLKSSNASSSMKKMAKGGVQKIVGMPGYNATLYPTSFKEGGATKAKKFAALAPPYDKPTAADRIAGAKMNKKKIGGPIKTKKYAAGGTSEPEPNPSGKSIGKQAGVFGGALAALVGLTREKGIERRAERAEDRYKKKQEKKQLKTQVKLEAKNMPKSKMGGMTKSKKK